MLTSTHRMCVGTSAAIWAAVLWAAAPASAQTDGAIPGMPPPPSPATPTPSYAEMSGNVYTPGYPTGIPSASVPGGVLGRAGLGDEVTPAQEAEAEAEAAEGEEPTPLLTKFLGLEEFPVKIYGWIQNSITGNQYGSGDVSNFGVNPNNLAGKWMGNQYYLVFEKPVERNDKINFGFRMDNLFGHDHAFNHMYGLLDNAFVPGHFGGWDPAQFYGEVHLPILTEGGVDVKAGRMYTLEGYEVVPAPLRPLLSVPYMFNYGQPFTHMGVYTTLHVNDQLDIQNCAVNGWDRFINENYHWGYMGGFTWKSEDEKNTVVFNMIWGPNQFPRFLPEDTPIVPTGTTPPPFMAGQVNPGYPDNDRFLFTTVVTHQWSDKLTQVIEADQAWEENIPNLGPNGRPQDATWFGLGNWFLYEFNEKATAVWRSEVFWDDQGARVVFGEGDRYYEQTLGMILKPYHWFWIRPEVRFDWAQYHTPYNNGTQDHQFTYGVDAILIF